MQCFKLTLAYDGSAYHGWQWQAGQATVQARLEEAWLRVTQEQVRATASGRTDAGVHAWGQVVACSSATALAPAVLLKALNANLPADIRVLRCTIVPGDFDPIQQAVGKTYHYWIRDGRLPAIFQRHYSWFVPQTLDVAAMHRAAQTLVGQHDFRAYQSAGSPRKTTVRTVQDVEVARCSFGPSEMIRLSISADGFLYNMVRNIVGTLVRVGEGRESERWPTEVLATGDRRLAGQTAPPQGLFLMHVEYEPPYADEPTDRGATEPT